MKPESASHLARAGELLTVAAENLDNNHPADSASRSYYAMFHAATAVLLEEGIERSSHKGVISAFGEIIVKGGRLEKRFHEYLREAFDSRILSDYFPTPSVSDIYASEMLANAEDFVRACRGILGE
ncbi:MAG: HEPN domain-containing protein [Nitrospinae bacterium]|nr:HEPN domain-containing protein [Nitrospinota bacterium]MBF0633157.1 HEPN domain-containing protein [Nitrospinota bacterium]